MYRQNSNSLTVPERDHVRALHKAHAVLKERLRRPAWGADDFYSAMAAYRRAAGIEFDRDDDLTLDKWVEAAEAAWRQELRHKGDRINLAEVLEKAIAEGLKAIGVSVGSRIATRRFGLIRGSRTPKNALNEGGAGIN